MKSFFVELIFVKSRVKAAGLGTLAAVAAALSADGGFAPETLSDGALTALLTRARTVLAERIFPPEG